MNLRHARMALAVTLLATLTGCSGFKLGGFCYLPAGQTGQCSVGASVPSQATVERMRE